MKEKENKSSILYTDPNGWSVLSLFDGMACGALALINAGIKIKSYDAFEIDKYAIETSTHNLPFINQHGDVFCADFSIYKGVDLLCGGSPCTYWSIAQKQNRETQASGIGWEMFSQYVRALQEAQPKYFIYENNRSMSKEIRNSIDQAFGFEAILINSSTVSAQNRQRLYWVGVRNADGTYSKVDVKQPDDRGVLLKDALDSNCFEPVNTLSNRKARCITANYSNKGVKHILNSNNSDNTHKQRFDSIAEPVNTTTDGKAQTLKAQYSKNGIANFITNGGFDATAVSEAVGIPTKAVSATDGKSYPVYEVKNGLIDIKGNLYPIKLIDGFYIIRKLTVNECKRLQTIPEWYEFPVSNSQAYKMLGNGWTVDVIAHILEHLK